jgi:beta-N-acetylhexosaminidase
MAQSSRRALSRREFLSFGIMGLAAGGALALYPPQGASAQDPAPAPAQPAQTEPNLEQMIGQMLLVGFRGMEPAGDNPIVADIRDRHLGGVVLFDYDVAAKSTERNIRSPEQVKSLIAGLQKWALTPLLVAVDQEGGKVNRLKAAYGFPPSVTEQYLGMRNVPALTRKYAERMADAMHTAGINLNLAPVVDLNLNPQNPVIGAIGRSYSADPVVVTRQASTLINEHHKYGVLCTLKHFPGHGSSTKDSHEGFVDVTGTWQEIELEPYKRLIQAGLADAVMTAHIFNANLDPKYPATLSPAVITGLLRQRLGYEGVVISDDMQMGAIRDLWSFPEALRRTIEAGVDIIAIANNLVYEPDVTARAIQIISDLVAKGTLSRERIKQSYTRITALKQRLAA